MKMFARRAVCASSLAGALALAGTGLASAHVTVHAPGAAQGGYEMLTFRVPTESATAGTTGLTVRLPNLRSARTEPMPGWSATVHKDPDSGRATSVTWTADPGVQIGPGHFAEFRVAAGPLPEKSAVSFPAEQTYSDGTVVDWDEQPAGEGAEPEHPAPSLTLEPAASDDGATASEDGGARSATSATAGDAGHDHEEDSVARWLGGAGLVLGALALSLALGDTIRRRRS